jgi:hypothetical protein
VTTDANGNVLTITTTEPRFSPAEVNLLLASRRQEREPRGRHGYTIAEATDPNNVGAFYVEDPTVDFAQRAYDRAVKAYKDQWGEAAETGSLLFQVEKR